MGRPKKQRGRGAEEEKGHKTKKKNAPVVLAKITRQSNLADNHKTHLFK